MGGFDETATAASSEARVAEAFVAEILPMHSRKCTYALPPGPPMNFSECTDALL